MAYISNLQEVVQPVVHKSLFSFLEYLQERPKQENIRPSLSVTLQESSEANVSTTVFLQEFEIGKPENWMCLLLLVSLFKRERDLVSYSFDSTSGGTYPSSKMEKQMQTMRNALVHKHPIAATTLPSKIVEEHPLEKLYVVRQSKETLQFIRENSFLDPLLREASTHIKRYFPSSELFLEVVADPDIPDEKQLVVSIPVQQKPEEASLALDELDENWWLDAMERAQNKLCITLEFE